MADDAWLEDGRLEGGGAAEHVLLADDLGDLIRRVESVLEGQQAAISGEHLFGRLRRLVEVVRLDREEHQVGLAEVCRIVRRRATHASRAFLYGGVPKRARDEMVQRFEQTDGPPLFVLSLKAGGVGLNLTAASYVVLYDPWWNPAVENQAIDRTHRIGQTSHVIAYRLLVKESIEEKIRKLQRSKRALAEDILGEESFTRALTLDDFRFLLGD